MCSRSSTAPLDRTFDGYYLKAGTKYWAILEDTIYGVPVWTRDDDFVLICFDKLADSSIPANQLQTGLLAYVTYEDRDDTPYVSGLAKLRSEHFSARRVGRSVELAYKGQVSEKRIPTEVTWESWLRFKIRVNEDRDRLICTVRKLYPLLKQEPDASDFLPCLEPLLLEESKNK